MKKNSLLFLLVITILFPASAHAGYWKNLGYDWKRGATNAVSCPLEIPIAIQDYHRGAGYPVVRHLTGFADGLFKAVARGGSGLWDFPAGLMPGIQEGLPVTPETLF